MNDRHPKLEPLEWRHAHDLQRVANDPCMSEWSNMPAAYFAKGAPSLIQRSLNQARKEGSHMLALYVEETITGVFSIQRDPSAGEAGHLLFWIEAGCWRSGRAIAYLADVVSFAMRDLGLEQLFTHCLERNTLCAKTLEAVGFERFGRRRSGLPGSGEDETELRFRTRVR